VDDSDRAVAVVPRRASYRKGVEPIHPQLHDFLKSVACAPSTRSARFRSELHQAVLHEVSPEQREGEVIGE
jgi:molecular chaperone GrpE (heat shock protein)